jgi:phosphoglycolate phosphatase
MKEFQLGPREVFLVGDELRDIEAAQETGVHMAAITWGYNSPQALAEASPDYLFTKPLEISDLLATMPLRAES